jgi:hypothetical protein
MVQSGVADPVAESNLRRTAWSFSTLATSTLPSDASATERVVSLPALPNSCEKIRVPVDESLVSVASPLPL